MSCVTCRHWEGDRFVSLSPEHRTGECPILKGKLEFTLKTGWDGGYVEMVDTPGDFGCIYHEEK